MQTTKTQRKRKFLLVLPLLALPFLTMAFWAMGGGSGEGATTASQVPGGLTAELPGSKVESEMGGSKLSFYDRAEEDSARMRQSILNDPYYVKSPVTDSSSFVYSPYPKTDTDPLGNNSSNPFTSGGSTESRIYDRIHQLEKVVREPKAKGALEPDVPQRGAVDLSSDLVQLESMMQTISQRGGDDPELRELNMMLDKVLDVQHPERLKKQKGGEGSSTGTSLLKINPGKFQQLTFFGRTKDTLGRSNSFYSESLSSPVSSFSNAIRAEIFQTQVVSDGSTVKLRLLGECSLGSLVLPKGSFIYAVARVSRDRLQLHIPSIRYQNSVLPVSMDVYDLDGLEGIFVNSAPVQEALQNDIEQRLGAIDIGGYDPSLKRQAASAGIQTAKSLLSKKRKPIQVTLKAGYQLLLKDKSLH